MFAGSPVVPLGVPWAGADIGSVGLTGSAAITSSGTIAVAGAGTGIGGSTDSFHFAYQPLVGNGSIVARLVSQSDTSGSAMSGIMLRESLYDDARFVDLVVTPGHGISFQERTVSHNAAVSSTIAGIAGEWLELVRRGSTITGAVSTNGVKWTYIGQASIALANNIYIGLCVTSHNAATRSTADFTHVAIARTGAQASPWTRAAPDPVTRWESESFAWQGRLYVFGGFTNRSLDVTTECDAFNPASNTWSVVTHMPAEITHAATTVVGDTVYFVGGNIGPMTVYTKTPTTSEAWTYNLLTGKWATIASLPVPTAAGGVVNIGNYLYFYGGISAGIKSDLGNTWAYDLDDPKAGWTKRAPMHDPRNHIGYVAIGGLAYAVGGTHLYHESTGNVADVDAYNPVTNTWHKVASLPMPWGSVHCDTLAVNGKIVIVGGQANGGFDGIYLTQIEEYNPATNKWDLAGSLPEPNEGQSAAYINNELIVVNGTVDNLGGWPQDETLIDGEIRL